MANLTVQQTKQLDTYLKTHKNVSREQAIKILFFRTPKTASAKGLEVEKSGGGQRAAAKKIRYNLGANSAKQGGILADKLYNQIEGASLNANTIKLLKQINPENVLFVLDAYNKKTKGKESLAQAIDAEWGLDATTVKEYICPALVKLAKNKNVNGVYFGDYMKKGDIKSLNEWIGNVSTKIKTSLGVNLAETTVVKKTHVAQEKPFKNPDAEKIADVYFYSQCKQSSQQLGKDLYNQIQGLSTPGKTRILLEQIYPDNVIDIMKEYEKQSKGKETLIDGIANEYGLNFNDSKNLCDRLYCYAINNGIKLKNLSYQENDIKSITAVSKKIYAKINAAKINKQTSLAPYTKLFRQNPEFHDDFENKTGVSFKVAILQDPTISKKQKIELIRNNFTAFAQIAKEEGIDISDIIKDANKDFQQLSYDNDFKKYSNLYVTTIDRLRARINFNDMELPTTKINGKIDRNFEQGGVGDCWFLAAIKGISRNPKGLKILNDSIKVNKNGTVTVHLKGVDKTYTISQKEIDNAKELSSGDGDVRALEIAVNRYFRDDYKTKYGNTASFDGNYEHVAYDILIGQRQSRQFYDKITNEVIDKFNDKEQVYCVSAHGDKKNIEVKSTSNTEGILTKDHAYTVAHVDSKYVYIINPWDTATELKVDRKTFQNFFTQIESFKI